MAITAMSLRDRLPGSLRQLSALQTRSDFRRPAICSDDPKENSRAFAPSIALTPWRPEVRHFILRRSAATLVRYRKRISYRVLKIRVDVPVAESRFAAGTRTAGATDTHAAVRCAREFMRRPRAAPRLRSWASNRYLEFSTSAAEWVR
jgi:hypothetical protein